MKIYNDITLKNIIILVGKDIKLLFSGFLKKTMKPYIIQLYLYFKLYTRRLIMASFF